MNHNIRQSKQTARQRAGFTLVEILIVVVILAILAAVIIPQFTNASELARAATLAENLRSLRTQIYLFYAEHNCVGPGYPDGDTTMAPTEAAFIAHMTLSSNAEGATAPPFTPGFEYGPYFIAMPPNPLNDKSSIEIIPDGGAFPLVPDNSHGYLYQASTRTIRADNLGSDENGRMYFDY
ncbi:MAG: type II secretion system protein [Planctomycetota bacterium]